MLMVIIDLAKEDEPQLPPHSNGLAGQGELQSTSLSRSCSSPAQSRLYSKRMLMYLIIALTILEFTADLIVEFNPSFSPRGWDTPLKVFCMAILVVMTLKQTFLPGPVNVHRVMGGVAAYLLIGVTWAFGYKLLLEMIPDAIHFQTPLAAGVSTGEPSRLIYFSFETLTTVSLRRRVSGPSHCAIAGHGRSAYRATVPRDPDRNIGRYGLASAV